MHVPGKIIFIACITLLSLQSKAQVVDTVLYPHDSAVVSTDLTTDFFQQGERITTPEKIVLITRSKKTIKLSSWLKSEAMQYSDHTLADIDNDGKKELLVSNFTGGAHCCDELYIFKNIAPNKYQHAALLTGGHTAILQNKQFEFGFTEHFGYFFTCYACGYGDTTDQGPVEIRNITLKYNKGKLNIVPGDRELRSTINDNLAKLSEQPYEKLYNDTDQDSGLRKEFAMNLAVFYYSFGKNLPETQKLFTKYYKYPDAKKVWAEFTKELTAIKLYNDF